MTQSDRKHIREIWAAAFENAEENGRLVVIRQGLLLHPKGGSPSGSPSPLIACQTEGQESPCRRALRNSFLALGMPWGSSYAPALSGRGTCLPEPGWRWAPLASRTGLDPFSARAASQSRTHRLHSPKPSWPRKQGLLLPEDLASGAFLDALGVLREERQRRKGKPQHPFPFGGVRAAFGRKLRPMRFKHRECQAIGKTICYITCCLLIENCSSVLMHICTCATPPPPRPGCLCFCPRSVHSVPQCPCIQCLGPPLRIPFCCCCCCCCCCLALWNWRGQSRALGSGGSGDSWNPECQ
ncbi:uncharacterized protein LOC121914586 isoform X2 [Sceloporus undulatus]|nr:uncharacterized protein LOC121914586 isoform X2 [Sceloporus undulatus]